jgi:hypothetical protein
MSRSSHAVLAALCSSAIACGGGNANASRAGTSSDAPVTPVMIASVADAGTVPQVAESKPAPAVAATVAPARDRATFVDEDDGRVSDPYVPRNLQNGIPPFDRGAAAQALSQVNISMCATPNGPRGGGHVLLTFHPSGMVQNVSVDSPQFHGTSVGACIASQYAQIQIPPFSGGPVKIGKAFILN